MIDKDRADSWGGIGLPDGTRLHKIGNRHPVADEPKTPPRRARRAQDDAAELVIEVLEGFPGLVMREDVMARVVADLAELLREVGDRFYHAGLRTGLAAQVIRIQATEEDVRKWFGEGGE